MQQRVMIAMALCARPKVLIADEPTTALDVVVQQQILGLLKDVRDQLGMGVLMITHNFSILKNFADRIAVMYRGRSSRQERLGKFLNRQNIHIRRR